MLARKGFCLVVAACDTGEEHEIGGPGLLMLLEEVEFNTLKEFSVESRIKDSKRLVEKLGIPHLSQCQDTLLRASYTGVDICMQSA